MTCSAPDVAAEVEHEILHAGAEFVLHNGDVSYADGDPQIWKSFFDTIEPFASVAPYMVGVGNHDYDYKGGSPSNDPSGAGKPYTPNWGNYGSDSGGECAVALSKRFDMMHLKCATTRLPFTVSD